jgi:hypothetical protein
MKPTNYKRGKYHKQNPKEKKMTFLADKSLITNLKQLSAMKHKSMSQVIRESIHDYYITSYTTQK